MLYNDLNYVNVADKIEVHTTSEFKNCNFQYVLLNCIISVIIHGAKVTKFDTHVVDNHSEGTMSQIYYLGLSFYLMKSRKLRCKKWYKVSRFLT